MSTAPPADTLTRDEAFAVAMSAFDYTIPGLTLDVELGDPESCRDIAHRLALEVAIRDGGGWWGDGNPERLDCYARWRGTYCPESFEMSAAGMSAIAELLPEMFAETTALHTHYVKDEHEDDVAQALRRVRALEGLAARLGVQITTEKVTA